MNYEFIMAKSEIIHFQEISILHLLFQSEKTTITLLNVIYAPKYNFNLLLLG